MEFHVIPVFNVDGYNETWTGVSQKLFYYEYEQYSYITKFNQNKIK